MTKIKQYLKLLRVHHYIKNVLVFVPIAFVIGKSNGGLNVILNTFLAFIAFCLISSAIYIFNDIKDIEKDKNHPTKCNRPLASGAIKKTVAYVIAVVLVLLTIVINLFVCNNVWGYVIFYVYFILNVFYSMGLKNVPIIDVAILASGYFIRVIYGEFVSGVQVSFWLYLTVIMLAFYLGFGKRRNEIKKIQKNGNTSTRKVLEFYNYEFLDKMMYMFLTMAFIFYSLRCCLSDFATHPIHGVGYIKLLFTIPLVLMIGMKYSLTVEKDSSGDPIEVILKDKILIMLSIIYVIAMGLIVYL